MEGKITKWLFNLKMINHIKSDIIDNENILCSEKSIGSTVNNCIPNEEKKLADETTWKIKKKKSDHLVNKLVVWAERPMGERNYPLSAGPRHMRLIFRASKY